MSFQQAVQPMVQSIPEEEEEIESDTPNRRGLIIGGSAVALLAIGAVTTISVCAAGKCRARRRSPFNESAAPTIALTSEPSDFPSLQPSIQPSLSPSLLWSDSPSSVPTDRPTLQPSEAERIAVAGEEDGCSLLGCYLYNIDTEVETRLTGQDEYNINLENPASYSIRCDTSEGLAYLDFTFDGETAREWNAPYWLAGNDAVSPWVVPVETLSSCGDKSFRVSASRSGSEDACMQESFVLTSICVSPKESQVTKPSILEGDLHVAALAATEESSCHLADCFLLNIDTDEELLLTGDDSYSIDPNSPDSFSVRCDVTGSVVDYLEFSYGDDSHREWNPPFWMNSNTDTSWVEPVDWLSSCGDKTFSIATSESSNETDCSHEVFKLSAIC